MRLPYYVPFRIYFSLFSFCVRQATRPGVFLSLLRIYLKRPEWLYYPGVESLPVKQFTFRPRQEPGESDIRLCERLIASYHLACGEVKPLESASGLWKDFIKTRYAGLESKLQAKDPRALARTLAGMFQESFLYGISSAHLGTYPGFEAFIRMKTTEELLALAESLAVVRTETPEQGALGHGLSGGIASIVEGIEQHLGISIGFPDIGGVYGLDAAGKLIMPEAPEHIYVASRISEAIDREVRHAKNSLAIVEIGAGFGGTAYWLNQLRRKDISLYTIIDLPLMNACQGYFLARAFGPETVRLYGESSSAQTSFRIIPPHAKANVLTERFQLLINENSMPEMPESVVKEYLTWARPKLTDIFYSYNQEAYSPFDGVPQTLVPKAVQETGGYKRLSRNYSWVRRGYVEEIYSVAG